MSPQCPWDPGWFLGWLLKGQALAGHRGDCASGVCQGHTTGIQSGTGPSRGEIPPAWIPGQLS